MTSETKGHFGAEPPIPILLTGLMIFYLRVLFALCAGRLVVNGNYVLLLLVAHETV